MPIGTIRGIVGSLAPGAPKAEAAVVGSVDTATPPPVVFVHGFVDTLRMPWWGRLRDHFRDAGWPDDRLYDVTTTRRPTPRVGSPRNYAVHVEEVLERAHDDHGEPVGLVCHSMGGLSARWCIEHGDGAPYTRDIVTVGTPHQGTYAAYLVLLTSAGRALRPGSSFLRELDAGDLEPSVRYTAVASKDDRLVIPRRSALLPSSVAHDDTENIAFESRSHIQLLHDAGVVAAYVDRLS